MRVAVIGSTGMLGRAMMACLGHEATPIGRYMIEGMQESMIREALVAVQASIVINCAGAIMHRNYSAVDMIMANSVLPHTLAAACASLHLPLLHVSTDCVFDGTALGPIPITAKKTPDSFYGLTKAVGEPDSGATVMVVRTSFIGLEHGFLRWLMDSRGKAIDGWNAAYWTGSTSYAVAQGLVAMLRAHSPGVYHLATKRITTKYSLATFINELFSLNLTVRQVDEPAINRALLPTHVLEPVEDGLEKLYRAYKTGAVAV